MKTIKLTAVALAIVSAMSGCADMSDAKTQSTALGAGIGCVGGMILGRALDTGNAGTNCAIGGAIGGAIGYQKAKSEELAAMKAAESAMPGALVETQAVAVTDKSAGTTEKIAVFKSMSVPIKTATMSSSSVAKNLADLGAIAKKQNATVTIVGGTAASRQKASDYLAAGGATDIKIDMATKASIGKQGDTVIIVRPLNAPAAAVTV